MPSFQISISPSRRAAARFVAGVRRKLQRALTEENAKSKLKQSDLARSIGVHRSVINRELRGFRDITLGRVAELAFAMGRTPTFELVEEVLTAGSNAPLSSAISHSAKSTTQSALVSWGAPQSISSAATSR